MRFLLADSFTGALARLPAAEAKAVKTTVVDLQIDPGGKGLSLHRIDKSKDPNFWSVRVGRDLRLIVHKTADSLLVAYVDHHDKAYAWAERRRIEAHPTTGAVQIVEVRERVEEVAAATEPSIGPAVAADALSEAATQLSFAGLDDAALLSVGVPADWLGDLRAATEDTFFDMAPHLPAEAAEALLHYATDGTLPISAPAPVADAYAHPDAQRRIRLIVDEEELRQALEYPWAGTISVFDGPAPVIAIAADAAQEIGRVVDFLRSAVADGIEPSEVGVFVRSPEVIGQARTASEASGLADPVAVSVMHLAKGLEFRAVAVIARDQDILPLESRIAEAADEGELDDIYETERQLLYVSCTRDRDRLLVTGVAPASEFLKDL